MGRRSKNASRAVKRISPPTSLTVGWKEKKRRSIMIQRKRRSLCLLVGAIASIAALGFASLASAHTGQFSRFNQCPSTTPGVFKCLQSITSGGKVVLGNKTVPIVNPVTLQGGLSEGVENPVDESFYESFYAASNGETLSKTPQPVPGGLSGLVNCKEISNWLVRIGCESVFENGLTGVNATLELAKPASSIVVNEEHLGFREGTAL
ncbi:MAG: hypothetical protein JST59_08940, partial [Actinobacteria bacterium]|nr:hypothetical protein [Actinomycetota bacterium]